jgi:hypothetical protein
LIEAPQLFVIWMQIQIQHQLEFSQHLRHTRSSTIEDAVAFSNISALSWRPVLVVEKAGVPGEYHRQWARNW